MRFLVIGVVMAALVVFDPRAGHPGGRPKYLVVLAGAAVALVLMAALAAVGGGGLVWRLNPLRWPVLFLVAWTGVSAIASPHPRTALFGLAGSYDGLLTTVAFAVLFFATVGAFGPDHVDMAAKVVCLGAGAAVVLFGVAQVADRLVSPNTGWDWARPSIAPQTIGSTLGNPNHLGGLLAMLVPLAVVLAVRAHGPLRTAIVAGIALALAELAITASRGAWLAVATSVLVLGLLFHDDLLPHRARVLAWSAGAVALVVVTILLLGAAGATKVRPGAVFRAGPGTTIDLRVQVWGVAWRMASDRPLTGVGPDVFALEFPAYETQRFMVRFGPFAVANGAHNLLLNTLADLGVVGLVAFLAVVAAAARALAAGWSVTAHTGERRLVLGGIVAGLVAYLVQGCLNTQTVALTLLFWFFLGLGLAVASGATKERG